MSNPASTDCVRVAIRVRPFIKRETDEGCLAIVKKTPGEPQLSITGQSYSNKQDSYTFNNVFMPEDTQDFVYESSVAQVIGKVFEGYNLTILAYGQTGSGKTYTMGTNFEGAFDDAKAGIIPRALHAIFNEIQTRKDDKITVKCSFMELYQEVLYDLLSGQQKEKSTCEIREDPEEGIFVAGLTEKTCSDAKSAANCLMSGGENRVVGATAMNDESSRSHAIFVLKMDIVQANGTSTSSKFTLVDLAGSERSKKTKATGIRFKEGVQINKGLLALGKVISILGGGQGDTKGQHITYRESKLTRLLQDSLGGNSVTLMIACVSPADNSIEETLSTLRYADRAKKIKNKPIKNQNSKDAEILELKDKIRMLQLQVLDQSYKDPVATGKCNSECAKKLFEKDNEIVSLHCQLTKLMNLINNLNDKRMNDESFYSNTIEKFTELKELLDKTCPAEYAMPDTPVIDQIKELVRSIFVFVVDFRKNVKESDSKDVTEDKALDASHFDDDASKQIMTEYTTNQMKALKQIQDLERDLYIKQDLLDRKNANISNEDNEKLLIEYREKIATLEKDLEAINDEKHSQSRRDHNVTKVNMDRKHKIDDLEKQLAEYRKKCSQLEKSKKLADQDRKRVEDLKREIQDLKTTRIQLIKQQRKDTEQFKRWERTKNQEINYLHEKERKHKNDMIRMERLHEKQQSVLKRKVEEAKSINKRLQEAIDKRSKNAMAKSSHNTTKIQTSEIIQTYIDQEIDIIISSVDATLTMKSLMDDRGLLNKRLSNLKALVSKTPEVELEIKQLQEDLELRNCQIQDIRQKVAQTDIESKFKSIPDNFKSLEESKTALGYVIRALTEMRENFTETKMKAEDLKLSYETNEERIEQLIEQQKKEREEFNKEKEKLEAEFEEKFSLLCGLNKGAFVNPEEFKHPEGAEGTKLGEIYEMMQKVHVRSESYDALQKRYNKLEQDYKELLAAQEEDEDEDDEMEEYGDGDIHFNDSFINDPDWVKTPKYRKRARATTAYALRENISAINRTGLLDNISESSDVSGTKRSFSGVAKCSCKGSCATKQCGCKKIGVFCGDTCKCTAACVNLASHDAKESDEEKENSVEIKKEDSKMNDTTPPSGSKKISISDADIITPYYPYKTKKRKPLLDYSP